MKTDHKKINKTHDDKTNNIVSAPGKYMLSDAFQRITFPAHTFSITMPNMVLVTKHL